jgi:hypothetical protein
LLCRAGAPFFPRWPWPCVSRKIENAKRYHDNKYEQSLHIPRFLALFLNLSMNILTSRWATERLWSSLFRRYLYQCLK